MLKDVLYFNVFLFFIMSIYFIMSSNKNNSKLVSLKRLVIVYTIYNFVSVYLFYYLEIVEVDWNVVFLIPFSIISFILYIISICRINKLLKNKKVVSNKSIKYIVIMIIPIILFISAYAYELYIINKCNYILKYNYQNGIVISKNTYIAIINDKTISITLKKNPFHRSERLYNREDYKVKYGEPIEITIRKSNYEKEKINDKNIEKIALDARKKNKAAKSALINYIPDGEYAIIQLLSEEDLGTVLDEYFYHNGEYVQTIQTSGDLDAVIQEG